MNTSLVTNFGLLEPKLFSAGGNALADLYLVQFHEIASYYYKITKNRRTMYNGIKQWTICKNALLTFSGFMI